MPAVVPFIPLIASGIGAAASVANGMRTERTNRQYLQRADQAAAAQQQLIGQLMSGITPDVYRAQAQQAGQAALSQLSSDFAQRGMLSSGAMQQAGARTLSEAYTNANAAYRAERMNAIGMALGGQQNLNNQWGQRINPDPYAGLGASLGAMGVAGAQYLQNNPLRQPVTIPMTQPTASYTVPGLASNGSIFGTTYNSGWQQRY